MTIQSLARQGTPRRGLGGTEWGVSPGGVARKASVSREDPPPGDPVTSPTRVERDGRPDSLPLIERLPRRYVSHVEALDVEPQPRRRSWRVQREHGGLVR